MPSLDSKPATGLANCASFSSSSTGGSLSYYFAAEVTIVEPMAVRRSKRRPPPAHCTESLVLLPCCPKASQAAEYTATASSHLG